MGMTDDQLHQLTITPRTRRVIVYCLTVIAVTALVAEVILALADVDGSESLLTVVATCVGGLAGLAIPPSQT